MILHGAARSWLHWRLRDRRLPSWFHGRVLILLPAPPLRGPTPGEKQVGALMIPPAFVVVALLLYLLDVRGQFYVVIFPLLALFLFQVLPQQLAEAKAARAFLKTGVETYGQAVSEVQENLTGHQRMEISDAILTGHRHRILAYGAAIRSKIPVRP